MTNSEMMRIDKKLAERIRLISENRGISMIEASRIIDIRFIEIEYNDIKKLKI